MGEEGVKSLASFPDKSAYDRIMSRGGKLYYNAPCMIVIPIKEAVPKGAHFKERLGFPEGYEIDIAVLLGFAENPGGKPHELDMDKLSFVE